MNQDNFDIDTLVCECVRHETSGKSGSLQEQKKKIHRMRI